MPEQKFVFFDVSIAGKAAGRIVVKLYIDQAINATDNFLELCVKRSYKKTFFHRVIRNFMVQGGNIEAHESDLEGKYPYEGNKTFSIGGYSIFKNKKNPKGDFHDENLRDLDEAFLVCMANDGKPDTNRSQFFITITSADHLNGKHTVVGKVFHGKSVVRAIEHTDVFATETADPNAYVPEEAVFVEDCGEWKEGDAYPTFTCCEDHIGGDIYEEFPDDNEIENLNLDNAAQAYDVCEKIKRSATLLLKAGRNQDSLSKYKKALRYCNELLPDVNKEKEGYVKFLELKKTLFLNLALVSLKLKQYNGCIDYCGYLFSFVSNHKDVKVSPIQLSKAFFRLGMAYEGLGKYSESLEALNKGLGVNPEDAGIKKEVSRVKKLKYESEKDERGRIAKFFG